MGTRRRAGLIFVGLLCFLGVFPPAWCEPAPDQTCLILSAASGLALEVDQADTGNLANVALGRANGGAAQCWRLRPERYGDAFAVVSLKSGRVLDVMGYSRENGANVQLFRDFGSRNQRWRLVPAGGGRFRVVAAHSGKCLTVPSGGGGTDLNARQEPCTDAGASLWTIEPYPHSDTAYRILSRQSGKALDVDGKSKEDGANIQLYHENGGPNQLWTLFPDGQADGSPIYSIISYHSGKAVDVRASSTRDGANAQQHAYNGGDNQRWKFVAAEGGGSIIISVNSGRCLDVKGASVADGANIQQARCNGGENQVWRLRPETIVPRHAPAERRGPGAASMPPAPRFPADSPDLSP